MADAKISDLHSASTLNTGDLLVLVQSGETKNVDVSTFLSKVPKAPVSQETPETVVSGALSKNIEVSVVSVPSAANVNYTLAAPIAADVGKQKIIVASAVTPTYTATITVTGGVGFTTATLSATGESVTLKEVGGYWYIVGGNGVVVA